MPGDASTFRTIKQTALAWGVSGRRVNALIDQGRVPGAVRVGREWLIPQSAVKPPDGRGQKPLGDDLAARLIDIIHKTSMPMPMGDPDAILARTTGTARLAYQSALTYLRGDFARTIACFHGARGDDAARLRLCPLAVAAAICTNNYLLFQQIEKWLQAIIRQHDHPTVTAVAQMGLNIAYVSAIAPQMACDWLKEGDFSALPAQLRLDACYQRAKYFQGLGQYEAMLAVSQTALALGDSPDGILYASVYLHHMRVAALSGLGRVEEARACLRGAMARYLPHGFVTPFAEAATANGGLVESLLEREFPAYYAQVTGQWSRTAPNWMNFHNRFTKENITNILSLREYQIARLAARGVSYAQIAAQFHISQGRVKNLMQEVCEKLRVTGKSRRKALAGYVL